MFLLMLHGTGSFTYIYHKLLSKWQKSIPVLHLGIVICVFNILEKSGVKYPRKKNGRKEISGPSYFTLSPRRRDSRSDSGGKQFQQWSFYQLGSPKSKRFVVGFFWGEGWERLINSTNFIGVCIWVFPKNRWVFPNLHPKSWSFLVGVYPWLLGKPQHFRKPAYITIFQDSLHVGGWDELMYPILGV